MTAYFMLLVVFSALLLPETNATESKSLKVQQPLSVSKFQNHNQETVGLLDGAKAGGRAQVERLSSNDEPSALPIRPGKQRRVSHIKASLLSVGLFATLFRNLYLLESTSRNDWVGFVFLLVLYLVEAATCSTRRYLSNTRSPSEVKEYIGQLQKEAPRVRFHLECYHYEDDDGFRYRHYSSSHQRHHTSANNRRVTHRASDLFEFQRWRDVTKLDEALESLAYGSNAKATYLKITLTKLLLFLNPMAYQEYLSQHAVFVFREGNRDRYTDSWTTIEVDGFTPKLLACRTVLGSQAHVRMPVFWLFTLVGFTVPYRIWFSRNCDSLDLAISKEVS